MIEIRDYQVSDYPQVREILEKGDLYYEPVDNEQSLERKIKRDPESILVAIDDGKVVGTQFIVEDFMPFLFRLAVHPEHRNKGIAKDLMRKGEDVLKSRGYDRVNILVESDEQELQEYYERKGYEKSRIFQWMERVF